MYQVANSYPKGSKDFVNVFDIAVRMYPTDQVAQPECRCRRLITERLEYSREIYGKSRPHNCRIYEQDRSLHFLNGDIQRAMAAFEQAAKLGNEAAQANLKQLQQILNVKMK